MQRVRGPVGDGAAGRDQRLPQYLAAEYRPGADILVGAAKQVAVEALQIEKMQQLLGIHDNQTAGGYHIRAGGLRRRRSLGRSRGLPARRIITTRRACRARLPKAGRHRASAQGSRSCSAR